MAEQQPTDDECRSKSLHYMFTKVPFTKALGITLTEAKRLGHGPGGRVDFAEGVSAEGVRSFVERRPPNFAPRTLEQVTE